MSITIGTHEEGKMDLSTTQQMLVSYVPRIAAALGILAGGFLVIHWLIRPLGKWLLSRGSLKPAVVSIALSMVVTVAWILVAAGVLSALGLTVIAAALSGSIALIALAVANAAKGTTSDIISGLFLAGDDDIDLGFRIKTGNVEGVVEKIDLRKVRIRDDEGHLHVLPNRAVEGSEWIVLFRGDPNS